MQWYNMTLGLNIYDLYRKNYDIKAKNESRIGRSILNGLEVEYLRGFTIKEYAPWLKHQAAGYLGLELAEKLEEERP